VFDTMQANRRLGFADPLREVAQTVFGLNAGQMLERSLKELPLDTYPYQSPRNILQKIGTDCFRSVWPEVWLEAAHRTIVNSRFDHIVITDLRFLNEAKAVLDWGGTIIKIDADERLGPNLDPHPSEADIPFIEADLVIENNGSLEDFTTTCRQTLKGLIND
jgi:hypothetical protein